VATQLAATKPTTPLELQFLSLLTSAKARIDTHNYHTTHLQGPSSSSSHLSFLHTTLE
jgi:hypothetical protein